MAQLGLVGGCACSYIVLCSVYFQTLVAGCGARFPVSAYGPSAGHKGWQLLFLWAHTVCCNPYFVYNRSADGGDKFLLSAFCRPRSAESGVVNLKIPYITVLIVAPVTFIVSTVAYFRNHSLSVCFECHARFGRSNERGFLGKVFSREGRFQLRMLMLASLIITVYAWIYYFWRYSNVNYNSADLFFYIWIPIILYVLSLVNLGIRYVSIDAFYRKNIAGEANDHVSSTLIRYIILCGDNMFLRIGGTDDLDTKADTPAQSYVPYRERVSEYDAINTFSNIVGNAFRPNLRFLYENSNFHIDCNIFHYICVLDSASELHGSGLDGEWLTQSELLRMVENREVSPMLISEIERLYTVIMAFKTYDISGRRLYDIKHYKPSFRLHDIASLLVDYNDPQWLFVAKDNEDRPFFYFKRFWRRYVRGISD